jgi:hypothetical protein
VCYNDKKYQKSENEMVKNYECPACRNKGINVEVNKGYKVVTTGRPMKDFPSVVLCAVCKRKIKYDVVKDDKENT